MNDRESQRLQRKFARLRDKARRRHAAEVKRMLRSIPADIRSLRPGAIVTNRRTGRKMELVKVSLSGLLVLTVAKSDPERKKFERQRTTVMWPADWCWLPGQQMSLF